MNCFDTEEESGILISILYLARQAAKEDMPHTQTALLLSAEAILKDCEHDPELHHELFCTYKICTDIATMEHAEIIEFLKYLEQTDDETKVA